jgi:hypothetical protein
MIGLRFPARLAGPREADDATDHTQRDSETRNSGGKPAGVCAGMGDAGAGPGGHRCSIYGPPEELQSWRRPERTYAPARYPKDRWHAHAQRSVFYHPALHQTGGRSGYVPFEVHRDGEQANRVLAGRFEGNEADSGTGERFRVLRQQRARWKACLRAGASPACV